MKKQLQIISSTMAREVNPYSKEYVNIFSKRRIGVDATPEHLKDFTFEEITLYRNWEYAESSLKEYRIDGAYLSDGLYMRDHNDHFTEDRLQLEIGSIDNFETNEELNTCVIL